MKILPHGVATKQVFAVQWRRLSTKSELRVDLEVLDLESTGPVLATTGFESQFRQRDTPKTQFFSKSAE